MPKDEHRSITTNGYFYCLLSDQQQMLRILSVVLKLKAALFYIKEDVTIIVNRGNLLEGRVILSRNTKKKPGKISRAFFEKNLFIFYGQK